MLSGGEPVELWICEVSVASSHKLAETYSCFSGSRKCIIKKICPKKFQVRQFGWGIFHPQT